MIYEDTCTVRIAPEMEFYKKITEILSLATGLILSAFALLAASAVILNSGVPENSFIQITGGIVTSGLIFLLGLPGLLSKFLKNKKNKEKMMRVNGYLLSSSVILFPFLIPAPVLVPLAVFILGASGIWITVFMFYSSSE